MQTIGSLLNGLAPIFAGDAGASRILDTLPVAVYATDADGRIAYFNQAAVDLWGRRPQSGQMYWCGSFKLYWPDGRALPYDQCPMAIALKERRPVRGLETVAERPDGTRVSFIPYPTPLFDSSGELIGAVNMMVDITDRKRAEAAALEQRNRAEQAAMHLASIVESSDDAIVSKDLDGIVVSWNNGAERLFGYSAAEMIGKSITILIPADRENEEPDILGRIRGGERIDHYETIRRRKDGSLADISLTVSPIRDGTGKIVGASKIVRDITERKRATDALARRMSEQSALHRFTDKLYRARAMSEVYDSALEAILLALQCPRASILLFDDAGVMRFIRSQGLSERYREAVEGHAPWTPDIENPQPIWIDDIAAAEMDESLKSTIAREGIGALAFIPLVAQGRIVGKFMTYYDGPHRFAESEIDLAVTIARQLGFSIERMRAEEELRRNEERERLRAAELRGLMEAVPAAIWIAHDAECRVITGNRTSFEVLRLPPHANLSFTAPEDERPRGFDILVDGRTLATDEMPVQRAARGDAISNFEEEVRFEDGTSRFLLGNAAPLLDPQGRPNGAVAAFVDITSRKQAEQQRDLLVAELNHRVKNTLATVIAISHQTFSKGCSLEQAHRSFERRVRALAQTHGRLAESNWTGVSLEMLLHDETAPYRDDRGNVRIAGPQIRLDPRSAVSLGMAFHELATNAAKYGALSAKDGSLQVTWSVSTDQEVRICWHESGGPPVRTPDRSGFGRMLLERALRSDLGADVRLDFATTGLQCAISFPLWQTPEMHQATASIQ